MNWWISIVFYLWRNSLKRWQEQPLSVLSKLVISCLIGTLGAVMILASSYLGTELERRLSDDESRTVVINEVVSQRQASTAPAGSGTEEAYWRELSDHSLAIYELAANAQLQGSQAQDIRVIAMDDPEARGYPDSLVLLSTVRPPGVLYDLTIQDFRTQAVSALPDPDLTKALRGRETILGSRERLALLMSRGYGKRIILRAKDLARMEKASSVAALLSQVERRQVTAISGLAILKQIDEVRRIQVFVLWAVMIGSSLVLGLVCGALAWMEFREERYLLALIRSFGVGRPTLLFHTLQENALVAVSGVLASFGLIHLAARYIPQGPTNLVWLTHLDPLWQMEGLALIAGAVSGSLLACVPVAIGLRKPLGLILK